MKFESSPKLVKKSVPLPEEPLKLEMDQETIDPKEMIDLKYEQEIVPILQVLKPDGVDFEEYESEVSAELFDDVKRIQTIQGRLMVPPDETIDEVKHMLISRIKATLEHARDYDRKIKPDPELVKKSKIALLALGDTTDIQKSWRVDYEPKHVQLHQLKDYIVGLSYGRDYKFTDSDIESLLKTNYGKIFWHTSRYTGEYGPCYTLPESFIFEVLAHNDKQQKNYVVYDALESAEEKKYDKKLFQELVKQGYERVTFQSIDKFSSIDPDMIYDSLGGNYSSFMEIKNSIDRSNTLSDKEKEEITLNLVQEYFKLGKFDDFDDVVKYVELYEEKKGLLQTQELIYTGIKNALQKNTQFYKIKQMLKEVSFPENRLTSNEMQQVALEYLGNCASQFSKNKYILEEMKEVEKLFKLPKDMVLEKMQPAASEEANGEIKVQILKNIQESFWVKDNNKRLPEQLLPVIDRFENQYGPKGKNLIALAIAAHGLNNPDRIERELKKIEQVLNQYDPDTIPEGAKVSMGIEYEATISIAETYNESSYLGYKHDIELISQSANIGSGTGGVHEIAPKPNYNPYMLMAEIKLMQEAGLLDLNFEKYPQAPRGYHLSLVGDHGLSINEYMYFLNNVMTLAQLTGITAGKEVKNTKDIYSKGFEHFSNTHQKGSRCEIKGMATDSIEQFEKAIITAHHAGIAMQLCNKYISNVSPTSKMLISPDYFEKMMMENGWLKKPFETDQERDIVFQWFTLEAEILNTIKQHNDSFVDSEFNGFILDSQGNYIDTGEHIDIVRNRRLVDEVKLRSDEFTNNITIFPDYLYRTQSVEFMNKLTAINNIFLKPPQGDENSPVNAKAVLDTMKRPGYGGIMDGRPQESIFENGGKFRDGYYYTQGASEEMIIHKAQILLNKFNTNMQKLLETKGAKREQEVAV